MKKILLFSAIGIFVVFGVMALLLMTFSFTGVLGATPDQTITVRFSNGLTGNAERIHDVSVGLFYNEDSNEYESIDGRQAPRTPAADTFSREGHEFVRWVGMGRQYYAGDRMEAGLTPDNDGQFMVAEWRARSFNITFDTGTWTIERPDSMTVEFGQPLNLPTLGPRDGRPFLGWRTAQNGGGQVAPSTMPARGLSLHAWWEPASGGNGWQPSFTVFLNANGGTGGTTSFSMVQGQAAPSINVPTRVNYTFAGFYNAQTGGVQYFNANGAAVRNITGTQTLWARWTATGNQGGQTQFTVTINANGGTGGQTSLTATQGLAAPSISNLPTRSGHTLAGFYNAATGGAQYFNANGAAVRSINGNMTVWARWTATGGQTPPQQNQIVHVTLNRNGGSGGTANFNHTSGTPIGMTISVPTRSGFTFGGYNDHNGNRVFLSDGRPAFTGNWTITAGVTSVTLTAVWNQAAQQNQNVTVTLNRNGGTGGTTQFTHVSGTPINTSITIPTRSGFTFAGYNDHNGARVFMANGQRAFTGNWTITAGVTSVTLTAQWTQNTNSNPGNPNPTTFTYQIRFVRNSGNGTGDNFTQYVVLGSNRHGSVALTQMFGNLDGTANMSLSMNHWSGANPNGHSRIAWTASRQINPSNMAIPSTRLQHNHSINSLFYTSPIAIVNTVSNVRTITVYGWWQ